MSDETKEGSKALKIASIVFMLTIMGLIALCQEDEVLAQLDEQETTWIEVHIVRNLEPNHRYEGIGFGATDSTNTLLMSWFVGDEGTIVLDTLYICAPCLEPAKQTAMYGWVANRLNVNGYMTLGQKMVLASLIGRLPCDDLNELMEQWGVEVE